MPQLSVKVVLPLIMVLALVGGGFMYFWNGMVQNALMGSNAKYSATLSHVAQGDPKQSYLCHPGAPGLWVGCSVTK